ncbi:MAG: mechanosensitive ion channel family protein, partial [Bdellovibrionales bacterium]|nr:mechanosensitive ion channel family protein [Bdellovibrionales bacterium]
FATQIAGNQLTQVASFFFVILAAFCIGKVVKYGLAAASRRVSGGEARVLATLFDALARSVGAIAVVVGLDLGRLALTIPISISLILDPTIACLYVLAVAFVLYQAVDLVDVWLGGISQRTESRMDDMLVPLVRKSVRVTIVVLTLLQIGTILSDKPLTSVLAGLGVGGLAVALAAQETLKNFFGSLVILSDKPFSLGERIVVGNFDGIVEEVGFRSTRLRTLDGHLVTIPNGELANQFIQNIGKRPHVKKLFNLGLPYDTSPEKLRVAVQIVRELLDNHEGMHVDFPPRVYFSSFDAYALSIEVLYWYHPAEWWLFKEFHESLCYQIFDRFESEGIQFAFPTQSLYVASDPQRPLVVGKE